MSHRSKKVILLGIVVVVAIVGAAYYFLQARRNVQMAPASLTTGSVITVRGTVVENVKSDAAGSLLKLKKDEGDSLVKVLYASTGCAYPFKQAATMQVGQKITVYGEAVAADTISVCPSGKYYIRVLK